MLLQADVLHTQFLRIPLCKPHFCIHILANRFCIHALANCFSAFTSLQTTFLHSRPCKLLFRIHALANCISASAFPRTHSRIHQSARIAALKLRRRSLVPFGWPVRKRRYSASCVSHIGKANYHTFERITAGCSIPYDNPGNLQSLF